jgi:hypothetical protein
VDQPPPTVGGPARAWVAADRPAQRRDRWLRDWYKRIRQRRGVKVARVAVMRRLATILWRMLREKRPYVPGDPANWKAAPKLPVKADAIHEAMCRGAVAAKAGQERLRSDPRIRP